MTIKIVILCKSVIDSRYLYLYGSVIFSSDSHDDRKNDQNNLANDITPSIQPKLAPNSVHSVEPSSLPTDPAQRCTGWWSTHCHHTILSFALPTKSPSATATTALTVVLIQQCRQKCLQNYLPYLPRKCPRWYHCFTHDRTHNPAHNCTDRSSKHIKSKRWMVPHQWFGGTATSAEFESL